MKSIDEKLMGSPPGSNYTVRQVEETDLPALTQIKQPIALHRDRIRDMQGGDLLYLVVEGGTGVIGYGLLVFNCPPTWPDLPQKEKLPVMVDLMVRSESRGQGAGSFLIQQMERIAFNHGFNRMYLSVNPIENKDALRLYTRLGYTAIHSEPYLDYWEFTDSDGITHSGEEWAIDMVKVLNRKM